MGGSSKPSFFPPSEDALLKIEEYSQLLETIVDIDLIDPETQTSVELANFPVHMPAAAALPLRCRCILYGKQPPVEVAIEGAAEGEPQTEMKDQDAICLELEVPRIERSELCEEMLAKGVLQKRQG